MVNGQDVSRVTMQQFKARYLQAQKMDAQAFMFQGQEVDVRYAHHLIEYAENELGPLSVPVVWQHMKKFRPSTTVPHNATPYARIGDTRCFVCGDSIEVVAEEEAK